ncbi:hypothetical protein [Siccibacter colletis]|uniref:Uncharacterized protein n=1 Tax=Siccibacter colletis TaxID=1505757 RepID=A0ABY6JDH7_9ENTR|nr:hypothetical protein [Siccibacter colletis]UYU30513.1 hypothetical protein KFZ77_11475 [Siccibacter colletis]
MKVIYQSEYGVAVLSPADCGLTVLEVGQKDVPAGLPFWLVNEAELPLDIPQEAWELDEAALGEPSGIGGTYREVASND